MRTRSGRNILLAMTQTSQFIGQLIPQRARPPITIETAISTYLDAGTAGSLWHAHCSLLRDPYLTQTSRELLLGIGGFHGGFTLTQRR